MLVYCLDRLRSILSLLSWQVDLLFLEVVTASRGGTVQLTQVLGAWIKAAGHLLPFVIWIPDFDLEFSFN